MFQKIGFLPNSIEMVHFSRKSLDFENATKTRPCSYGAKTKILPKHLMTLSFVGITIKHQVAQLDK